MHKKKYFEYLSMICSGVASTVLFFQHINTIHDRYVDLVCESYLLSLLMINKVRLVVYNKLIPIILFLKNHLIFK